MTFTNRIPAAAFQDAPEVRENRPKGMNDVEACFVCGRGMTAAAIAAGRLVHLATDGNLVSREETKAGPVADSQGAFPVGSECYKRIPEPFRL